MIVLRLAAGVCKHFPLRVSEWLMAIPSFGIGLVLLADPSMFDGRLGYATMARWAEETTWGLVLLATTALRLLALVVNGSFNSFRLAPHLRAGASLVGAVVWGQYCMGLMLQPTTSWAGPIPYATFVVAELANWHRAWKDIGAVHRRAGAARRG